MPAAGPHPSAASAMSTSSYSRSPSWTTVSPPAAHEPTRGERGEAELLGRPSAVRPRSTTVKAHSACDVVAGVGQRQVDPQAVVARRIDEPSADPQRRLVGPQLERGRDGHRHVLRPAAWAIPSTSPATVRGDDVERWPAPVRTRPGRPRTDSGTSTIVSSAGASSCRCRRGPRRRRAGRSRAPRRARRSRLQGRRRRDHAVGQGQHRGRVALGLTGWARAPGRKRPSRTRAPTPGGRGRGGRAAGR